MKHSKCVIKGCKNQSKYCDEHYVKVLRSNETTTKILQTCVPFFLIVMGAFLVFNYLFNDIDENEYCKDLAVKNLRIDYDDITSSRFYDKSHAYYENHCSLIVGDDSKKVIDGIALWSDSSVKREEIKFDVIDQNYLDDMHQDEVKGWLSILGLYLVVIGAFIILGIWND